MPDKVKVRDVGLREIYDSYMGILRISPDEEMRDDMTDSLIEGKSLPLSDSDGNQLPITFASKFRKDVSVMKTENLTETVDFVSVITQIENRLFASESANICSTLYLNKVKDNEAASNLAVMAKDTKNYNRRHFLLYPLDSPHDSSYWNNFSKLKNVGNYKAGRQRKEKLEEILLDNEQSPLSWYDTIDENNYVKVKGKTVYVTNNADQLVPVLYTKDYVLGHRRNHTGKLHDASVNGAKLQSKYISNTLYGVDNINTMPSTTEQYIDSVDSYITRLSFFDMDKLIWKGIEEVSSGKIRHYGDGRYQKLGRYADINLKTELFKLQKNIKDYSLAKNPSRAYSFIDTAPMLGTDVAPGIIVYNAIPFRQFAYNALRQIATNEEDFTEAEKKNANVANAKSYKEAGRLKKAGRGEKTGTIKLVKNFILCDGMKIDENYINHPHVDIKNEKLKALMNNSGVESDTIYEAFSNTRDRKTIDLLDFKSTASRFLRGQMWHFTDDYEGEKIVDLKQGDDSTRNKSYNKIASGDKGLKIEVITMDFDETSVSTTNPYAVRKNFVNADKPYVFNFDSLIQRTIHRHYIFSSENGQYNWSNKDTVIAGSIVCRKGPWEGRRTVRGDLVPWILPTGGFYNPTGMYIVPVNNSIINYSGSFNKKQDEIEASFPMAATGGGEFKFENGYTVREGRNSSGHKHKTKYKYSQDLTGGYKIQCAPCAESDVGAKLSDTVYYVEVGLTSHPYTNREYLGVKGAPNVMYKDETEYKYKNVEIGGNTRDVWDTVPNPPSINLLPLLRI